MADTKASTTTAASGATSGSEGATPPPPNYPDMKTFGGGSGGSGSGSAGVGAPATNPSGFGSAGAGAPGGGGGKSGSTLPRGDPLTALLRTNHRLSTALESRPVVQSIIKNTSDRHSNIQGMVTVNAKMNPDWQQRRKNSTMQIATWMRKSPLEGKIPPAMYPETAGVDVVIPPDSLLVSVEEMIVDARTNSLVPVDTAGSNATVVHASLAGIPANAQLRLKGVSPIEPVTYSATTMGAQGYTDIASRIGGTAYLPIGPRGIQHGRVVIAKMPRKITTRGGVQTFDVVREGFETVPLMYAESPQCDWAYERFALRMAQSTEAELKQQLQNALNESGKTSAAAGSDMMAAVMATTSLEAVMIALGAAMFSGKELVNTGSKGLGNLIVKLAQLLMGDADAKVVEARVGQGAAQDGLPLMTQLVIQGCAALKAQEGPVIGVALETVKLKHGHVMIDMHAGSNVY